MSIFPNKLIPSKFNKIFIIFGIVFRKKYLKCIDSRGLIKVWSTSGVISLWNNQPRGVISQNWSTIRVIRRLSDEQVDDQPKKVINKRSIKWFSCWSSEICGQLIRIYGQYDRHGQLVTQSDQLINKEWSTD